MFKTFDTAEELKGHLQRLFTSWLDTFGDKVPHHVEMLNWEDGPSMQQPEGVGSTTVEELLSQARALERQGLVTQAEDSLRGCCRKKRPRKSDLLREIPAAHWSAQEGFPNQ